MVEMTNSYQVTAFHMEQSGLAQRLADIRVVGGYQQLHRIVERRLKSLFRRLSFRQPPAHGNDKHDSYNKAQCSRHEDGKHVHGFTGGIFVEVSNDNVSRCTNQRTDTTHLYRIHHRKVQFRRYSVQFPRPAFHHITEEYGQHRVADESAQHRNWHHHAQEGRRITVRQSEYMLQHPLQYTCIA